MTVRYRKPSSKGSQRFPTSTQPSKKQAQILPDSGLQAALTDETIMETIYSPSRSSRRRGRQPQERKGFCAGIPGSCPARDPDPCDTPETLTVKEFAEAIQEDGRRVLSKN
jgi:hypothetical protein